MYILYIDFCIFIHMYTQKYVEVMLYVYVHP